MKANMTIAVLFLTAWLSASPVQAESPWQTTYFSESGYLRVEGAIELEIKGDTLTFSLFPTAHISLISLPGLVDSKLERTAEKLTVTLQLEVPSGPTELALHYEGFLPENLSQDDWFPHFSAETLRNPLEEWLGELFRLVAADDRDSLTRLISAPPPRQQIFLEFFASVPQEIQWSFLEYQEEASVAVVQIAHPDGFEFRLELTLEATDLETWLIGDVRVFPSVTQPEE